MRPVYRALQVIGQSIFTPVWRMTVVGRRNIPASGGVVAICNHQSFLDLILVGQAINREITYVARTTLWDSAIFRSLTFPFRLLAIRRGEADLATLKAGIERLKNGELLLLFPEGTRTRDGRVGEFSMGYYTMAHRAGAPILPMRISGSFQAWPRHQPLPLPGPIRLTMFPPLDPKTLSKDQVRDYLQSRIYSGL